MRPNEDYEYNSMAYDINDIINPDASLHDDYAIIRLDRAEALKGSDSISPLCLPELINPIWESQDVRIQ